MKRKIHKPQIKVLFEFLVDTKVYKNNMGGRIKIGADGFIQYLIKEDEKWKIVKGSLKSLRMIKLPVGITQENASGKNRKKSSATSIK